MDNIVISRQDIETIEKLLHLDNLKSDTAISKGENDDMAKERRRVIISWNDDGTPVYKEVQGADQEEVNLKIVKAFVDSGRIWEVMGKPDVVEKTEGSGIVFKEYAEKWLARKRKIKANTFVRYRKTLTEYILPCLGEKLLVDIDVDDVQAMLDRFSYLSEKTLKETLYQLSQIMKYAIDDDIISKNPCRSRDLVIPSDRKTEREALPLEQYKDILANIHKLNIRDQRYLGLVMYTGMRRGEALGVRWEDIDLEKNVIHIRRNVTHPQRNTPDVTTPKTKAGLRDIPMDENLLKLLTPMEKQGYIVSGEKPMTLSAYRAMWKRINKINLYGATAHVLRHSYLTYAVGETTDYKTVQGISGHSDLGTLLNRYAHPQEAKVKALTQTMHKVLDVG